MKKPIFLYIYSLALCLPLLFSCSDIIPEDERYEELPAIEAKRRILLEDFTGQFCSNCPEAHKVISELQTQYEEDVIAVAIHAGHFGIAEGSNPNVIGLMQPEGDIYATHWGVEAYPIGLINRTSGLLKHTEWAAYAREALNQEAMVDIALDCKVSDDSTRLCINTEIISNATMEGNNLQLWITESNINAVQQNGSTLDANYNHHHVLRTAVNGQWGEAVTIPSNTVHYIDVRDNWNIDNLSVVAFVYNNTDGVLQAAEHHFSDKGLAQDSIPQGNQNGGIVVVRELTFLCGEDTIPNGSTYTSSKLDEAYTAMGMTRFVPGIDLVGDKDGQVTVTVKSLNQTMIEICAFGGCQMTLPHLGYSTSASGTITAGTPLPLDIHYTPTMNSEVYRAEALITVCYEGEEAKAASFTLVMTNEGVE